MEIDHILIAGFGGPEKPDDIVPFLRHVTAGRGIPEPRIQAVARQYEQIGGKSPYHENVCEFKALLETELRALNIQLPVFIGYRHWHPFMEDTAAAIAAAGLKKGAAFILAPFRSPSSCKRYKDAVRKAAEAQKIAYVFTRSWGLEPKVLEAAAETAKKSLTEIPDIERPQTAVLFSCHSIPVSMLNECSYCNYENEVREAASKIATANNLDAWQVAYHSRSGNPRDPWLGPDICEAIQALPEQTKRVLIIPLGFVCENAEILYDLDILARDAAVSRGLEFIRSGVIYRHPLFISAAAAVIGQAIRESGGR